MISVTSEPKVLNKKNNPNSEGSVYIGRPSKFGNPFVIGKDGTRAEVIKKYEAWLLSQPKLVKAAKTELKGKNLLCWCSPQACHGDVLLRVANSTTKSLF